MTETLDVERGGLGRRWGEIQMKTRRETKRDEEREKERERERKRKRETKSGRPHRKNERVRV